MSETKISKKRKYSRQGCLECKRRKIKCDETKPECKNCVKIRKECFYKSGTKFSERRTKIIEVKQPDANSFSVIEHFPTISNVASPNFISASPKTDTPIAGDVFTHFEPIHHASGSEHSMDGSDVLYSGASMLANDLTDLLSIELKDVSDSISNERLFAQQELNSHITMSKASTSGDLSPTTDIFEDESILSLIAAYDLISGHKNYLRLFYEKYSLWLLPLFPASGPKNFLNKIIIQQALRQPFLLNAIFSIAASFEYQEGKLQEDDTNKRFYINLCLKGLSTVFANKTTVAENIEPLILTSLLLVTESASALNGSWRTHLRGANDLFRQYLRMYKKNSPTILLSTTWFASFEIIAVVTNPLGGSITSSEQLDDILQPVLYREDWNLAIQLGLVLPNGYNVFLGMSSSAIHLCIHVLKLAIKIRKSASKSLESDDLVEVMSLFKQALSIDLASRDGIILPNSPYYPKTSGMNFLPLETYGYKGDLVFSWFDSSDKTHLRALYLSILTNSMFLNLPKASPVVQDVVKKILDMCHFFHDIDFTNPQFSIDQELNNPKNALLKDRRLFMFHSPLFICGLNSIHRVDRLKIELYFNSLMKLGNKTVENSFNKIKSHWTGGDDNIDFVPYL